MSTMEHKFEPMTTGMLLDKAFQLYTQNFALMLGLSAALNIPLLAFNFIMGSGKMDPLHPNFFALGMSILAGLIALLIIAPLINGAMTKAVSEIYVGNSVTAQMALLAAWSRIATLLITQFVVGLIVIVGVFLLFVPGILWSLSYALVAPIIMVESLSKGRDIRHRSWMLVKGNRGKVFLVFIILIVIQLLAQAGTAIAAGLVMGFSNTTTLQTVLGGVVSILMGPMFATTVTLLYYDFRIRKEGFDLEMLSQALGNPTPGA